MRGSDRFERRAFGVLTACAAAIVAWLPVVPGHDTPQHLAYVGLVATWQEDPRKLADVYDAPDLSNVARVMGAELALRLVVLAYVVLLALAIRALVRATWQTPAPATSLLAPVLAFNPVLWMGFLAYFVSHVIVRWPARDGEPRVQKLASRVIAMREQGVLRTVACDGDCCLFAVAVAGLAPVAEAAP